MDPELQIIKNEIIAMVLGKEDEIVTVQEKINTALAGANTDFENKIRALEVSYKTRKDAEAADFMKEYRALEALVHTEASQALEAIRAAVAIQVETTQ